LSVSNRFVYVLTNVKQGDEEGPGIMAVSLTDGKPGASFLLDDKDPLYSVDDVENRFFYFKEKKQLTAYSLK